MHRSGPTRKFSYHSLFAGIFGLGLILFGSRSVINYANSKTQPTTATQATPTPNRIINNLKPVWPTVGQAAVGSVEEGLLAQSSFNEKPRPTASMAKVITALAIMDKQPLQLGQEGPDYTITRDDIATMSEYIAEEGSVQPLLIGMHLNQYQAMQRILIASDNNMADILVTKVFGSKSAYLVYAKNMLKRLGLNQTIVADASGFNSATVSTPSEMVKVGIAAMKNPVIAQIVAQSQAKIANLPIMTNTNQLLGSDGVVGIKTGTTNDAGHCLLFAARVKNADGKDTTLVGVIMGEIDATSLYSDSRKLLASVKQGLGLTEAQSASSTPTPFPQIRMREPRK